MPESGQLADDLETLSGEFEGRFLVGLVDIDAAPQIAQAMQIPSIPLVVAVLDGRPMPLFQDVLPIEELRTALTTVVQQFTTQGITGRHQPRGAVEAPSVEGDEAPPVDPRYAPAQDALGAGDIETAVTEYQKLVDANPADAEAVAGLAMAKVLLRTQGVDLNEARAAAAAAPDDIDARRSWPTSTCWAATSTTRSRGWSTSYAARPVTSARRRATTCWDCSPPSATTTSACSRAVGPSLQPCSERRVSRRDSVLAALVAVIWGVNFLVIDWGMAGVPPLLFLVFRFVGVALPAVFLVRRPQVSWWVLAVVGLTMSLGQFGLLYAALAAGMPPGLAGLVLQAQIVFTVVLSAGALAERPSRAQLSGVVLGSLGLVTIAAGRGGNVPLTALLLTVWRRCRGRSATSSSARRRCVPACR